MACCPVGHRDAFTYSAPQGDCLGRKAKAVVSNPDLAIDQLYAMLCTPTEVEGEEWPASQEAWYTYLRDIIVAASSAIPTTPRPPSPHSSSTFPHSFKNSFGSPEKPWAPLGPLLGPFGVLLGPLLGPLGALLGPN